MITYSLYPDQRAVCNTWLHLLPHPQNPETLTNKLSHLSSLLGLSQEELERVVYTYPT
jgi:hypothetical protein